MSSPRRGGNEQSILEMLDRDSGVAGGLQGRSHFGWYAAGGVLAASLVGLLVWVAYDSPKVQQAEAVLAAVETGHPAPTPAGFDNNVADAAPALAHAPGALPAHAAIVDERQASSRAQDNQDQLQLPPLVLAKPGVLGAVPETRPSAGAVVQDDRPATAPALAAAAQAEPAPPATGQAAPAQHALAQAAPEPATPERQASPAGPAPAQAAVAPSATAKPSSPVSAETPRSRTDSNATPASKRTSARKPAHHAAKPKKPAAPARTGDTKVDSDVALISAVIQHTSKRADPPCADAKCAAKATPEP